MDYKKKYEQALERAKMYQGMIVLPAESMIETIFPELKENDDEKIRKEIIQSIQDNMCVIHKDECIAWLEKQGHTDSIVEKAKTEKQRIIVTETDGNANIDWDTRSLEDARRLLECGLQYINTELEKQSEQKSSKWNKEDEEMTDAIIADVKFTQKTHTRMVNQVVYEKEINWLKSLKQRL